MSTYKLKLLFTVFFLLPFATLHCGSPKSVHQNVSKSPRDFGEVRTFEDAKTLLKGTFWRSVDSPFGKLWLVVVVFSDQGDSAYLGWSTDKHLKERIRGIRSGAQSAGYDSLEFSNSTDGTQLKAFWISNEIKTYVNTYGESITYALKRSNQKDALFVTFSKDGESFSFEAERYDE